jgi:hypothetical protein
MAGNRTEEATPVQPVLGIGQCVDNVDVGHVFDAR